MTLQRDVTALMAKGGFPMRNWISSPPEVLATVPEAERAVPDNRLELGKLPLVAVGFQVGCAVRPLRACINCT